MMNLVEQIIEFVDFNDDYFCVGPEKKLIGFERNVYCHPFTKEELSLLGRYDFAKIPLSKDEGIMLLVNDVDRVETQIKNTMPWEELNKPRQAACINVALIIGVDKFLEIERKLGLFKNCFYEKFVRLLIGLKISERHRSRIMTMGEQMLTGEWC